MEQAVFEEHVLGLAPGAVDDDHVALDGAAFLPLRHFLQVLGLGSRVQDQRPAVPAHGGQLRVSEGRADGVTLVVGSHRGTNRAAAYRSSLNRRPTMTLHFPGGKQAASRGTVRRTLLSWEEKQELERPGGENREQGEIKRQQWAEELKDSPLRDAGLCTDRWRPPEAEEGGTGRGRPSEGGCRGGTERRDWLVLLRGVRTTSAKAS